jgi:hypothetical protein
MTEVKLFIVKNYCYWVITSPERQSSVVETPHPSPQRGGIGVYKLSEVMCGAVFWNIDGR